MPCAKYCYIRTIIKQGRVQAAEPYSARTVLGAVQRDMLRRWEQRKPYLVSRSVLLLFT